MVAPCATQAYRPLAHRLSFRAVHKQVTKNPAFEKTPLFVFLNKKDLFEDYIRVKVSLCMHSLWKWFGRRLARPFRVDRSEDLVIATD
jgi:hypothetical protein